MNMSEFTTEQVNPEQQNLDESFDELDMEFSEQSDEKEQNDLADRPSYRRFRGLRPHTEEEADNNVDAELVSLVDGAQSIEVISHSEIQAYKAHDEAITRRYEHADIAIRDVNQRAKDMHTTLIEQVNEDITSAKELFKDRREQIDALADSMINAINQMRAREIEKEKSTQNGSIAESERMEARADDLLEGNQDAIKKIYSEIEKGQTYQRKLEKQRDDSITLFNELVARKDQREIDLATTEDNLSTYKEKLSLKEARREELFEEETMLKAEERNERETLAGPAINALLTNYGALPEGTVEDGVRQETSQAIKDSVKSIKNGVQSAELSRILGNLKKCNEKQDHNAESIAHLGDVIDESELQINMINDELQQITLQLAQLKAKLDGPLTSTAMDIETHSADAMHVAEVFEAIIHGDTTAVSGNVIPGPLHHVWDNMVAYQKAIERRENMEDNTNDWKPPVFEINIFSALGGDPDSDPTLADEREMQEVINSKASQLLVGAESINIMGQIAAKGVFNRGMTVRFGKKAK